MTTSFDARYAELVAQVEAGKAAQVELSKFDALLGTAKTPTPKPAKKTGKSKKTVKTPTAPTTPGTTGPGRHPKGKASAKDAAMALLANTPDGMTLDQVATHIRKAGYKSDVTDPKKFKMVVYQALHKLTLEHKVINDNHHWKSIAA